MSMKRQFWLFMHDSINVRPAGKEFIVDPGHEHCLSCKCDGDS